jgi:hypothetical protein
LNAAPWALPIRQPAGCTAVTCSVPSMCWAAPAAAIVMPGPATGAWQFMQLLSCGCGADGGAP